MRKKEEVNKRVFIVPTPKGEIRVLSKDDGIRPGIFVDFVSSEIKENFGQEIVDGKYAIPLACVEYNVIDRKLNSFIWENADEKDYSEKFDHTDALKFNDHFMILENGTEVIHNYKKAFIVGNNADNCPGGYEASLNYFIKYADTDEAYEDVKKRLYDSNGAWCDAMDIWHNVKPICEQSINTKVLLEYVDSKEIVDKIIEYNAEIYGEDKLSEWNIDKWKYAIFATIIDKIPCLISDFIYDNKGYFVDYVKSNGCFNTNDYIHFVLTGNGKEAPFSRRQPKEFFDFIEELSTIIYTKLREK